MVKIVFDNRLGERVTSDILSDCHQCGSPLMNILIVIIKHAILFIQCKNVWYSYLKECRDFIKLPIEKQKELFKSGNIIFNAQKSDKETKTIRNK